MTRVLPYLSPSEGREVLTALANAPCLRDLQGAAAKWPVLLRHVAARDAQGFGKVAEEMLFAGQGNNPVKTRYLLAMAMLGHIHTGQPGPAAHCGHASRRRA